MKNNKLLAAALLLMLALVLSACSSSSSTSSSNNWPGVAVEEDTVYAANGSAIEAVRDGKRLWTYPTDGSKLQFFAAPAVDDTQVYAGTYSNQLHILNKEDGTLAASIELGSSKEKVIASPILADGNVIVLSSGGTVSAYKTDGSAEPVWQTKLSNELWVTPTLDNGTLYIITLDKKINLLDAATGELKQSVDINGAVMSEPVLYEGKLYFSTFAKEVDAMDLSDGTISTVITVDGEIWGAPLILNGKIIAADMSGYLYIADLESGELLWKSERVAAENYGFIASPVAVSADTFAVVDETGVINTYDLDGKSVSQRTLGAAVYTTPASMENGDIVVIPVSSDGDINVYTADLKEEWVYKSTAAEASAEAEAESTEEGK